ncbi:MAG TPA: hypothetical protein VGG16_29340 [Streptosporangiaceae bacterium]|jgi:hypothetical protein
MLGMVAGTLLISTSASAASGHAADSGHAAASERAVLRASTVMAYRGGTFSLQTTCPEPSRSTRLESALFSSPALLPAQLSGQATWTVSVAPRQRPGNYSITLNCFELGTGRVTAADSIRVDVLGSLQRAPVRGHRHRIR